MITFLALALHFQNQTLAAITVILCLLLAFELIPGVGGVQYQTGANISTVGDDTFVVNNYSSFTNSPIAIILLLLAVYLAFQIIDFRRGRKQEAQEAT